MHGSQRRSRIRCARILAILNDRVASPNEIAGMINERLPNVSGYHVRALHELECIELVRTARRCGAIEHYYRALKRPFFSDRDWKRLPQSARRAMSDVALQLVWNDVSTAIEENTFERRRIVTSRAARWCSTSVDGASSTRSRGSAGGGGADRVAERGSSPRRTDRHPHAAGDDALRGC